VCRRSAFLDLALRVAALREDDHLLERQPRRRDRLVDERHGLGRRLQLVGEGQVEAAEHERGQAEDRD
jgi:hypothetical protein